MRLILISVLIALVWGCRDAPASASADAQLQMEEELAIAIPASAPLLGVTAGKGGRMIAWSRNDAYLLSPEGPPQRVPVRFAGPPAGAAFGADGVMEFVDPAASVVRRSTMAGETGASPLPSGLRVVDAVRTEESGWIAAILDADGRYRVGPLDGAAWWVIAPDTLRGGALPPYRLAAGREGVLVTEAEPPFRTWRVSSGGVAQPFAPTGAEFPDDGGVQRWVSAPLVDLGDGLVQTLADLASDRRVLVLYDHEGREQRKTLVAVPMALVGVTDDGRHLVGVRDVGNPEVVLYRWRWTSNHYKGAKP